MPSPIGENEALKTALLQLRSNDVLLQNEGVAIVIRIGAAAVPALLPLLEDGEASKVKWDLGRSYFIRHSFLIKRTILRRLSVE